MSPGKIVMGLRLPIVLTVLILAAAPARGAPESELWPRWVANNPASALSLDHGPWDRFLATYAVADGGVNRVAYGRVTPEDRRALEGYIASLAATPADGLRRAEQLPFWINLYNALTVKVVLDHYPVQSIKDIDISPGLFADGPWGKKLVTVAGEAMSLDDIEHRILRPIWKDPRLHYVLTCAALGCPNLQPRAFTAGNAQTLLSRGARQYVNDPRGVAFDGERLIVSSLYDWYAADFGGTDTAIISHLKRFAGPVLLAKLEAAERIDDDYYDWTLNDAP